MDGGEETDVVDVDRDGRGVAPSFRSAFEKREEGKVMGELPAPVGEMGGARTLTTSNGGRARDQRGMAGGRPGGRGLWHGAHQ